MAKVIMDAETAARMTAQYAREADDESLENCHKAIKAACMKGKCSAYVKAGLVTSGAVRALKNVGYNISFNQQEDEYIINW